MSAETGGNAVARAQPVSLSSSFFFFFLLFADFENIRNGADDDDEP